MQNQSTAPQFTFAVTTISELKQPVKVLALVEGKDWDAAAREAFSIAREAVHRNGNVVTGIFEVRYVDNREVAHLIATAGFARFSRARVENLEAIGALA
jgi:hypothetical protein